MKSKRTRVRIDVENHASPRNNVTQLKNLKKDYFIVGFDEVGHVSSSSKFWQIIEQLLGAKRAGLT